MGQMAFKKRELAERLIKCIVETYFPGIQPLENSNNRFFFLYYSRISDVHTKKAKVFQVVSEPKKTLDLVQFNIKYIYYTPILWKNCVLR